MNPLRLSDRRKVIAKWLMLLAVLAFEPELVTAQVTATLIVRNPMPSQLSTWETDPTLVELIIVNSGNTAYQNVRASFVVEDLQNNGATVVQSKDDDPSMPRFDIPANTTVTKLMSDIFSVNAVSFNSSYQKTATTTNSIPEGQYDFCVTLIDENSAPITQTGQVCMPFSVFIPDPPTLTFPTDQSTILDIGAIAFSWTPVVLGTSQVDYQLTIVPIFQNQTPKDAIQSNPSLFKKILTINSYVYTQADPPFSFYPSAIGFAWQVQALDQQNLPVAKNEGKSEIFSFKLPGKTSSSPLLTLEPYYPQDGDTIPWVPPHMIVRFTPYSDSITQMDYTLNVSGSNNSSYTCHRVLKWPQGPRISQGWTNPADTDRARYIIADLDFSGDNTTVVLPPWFSSLKRGVKYTWSVGATFTRAGKTITANTGNRSFTLGATSPILDDPSNNSVIDSASQPVKLTWHNNAPASLNPDFLVGMGTNLKAASFKGVASELWRLEMSHDSTFAAVDTTDSLRVPAPPDSTGGQAVGLYQSRSFTLKALPPGKYWWRASWIDNGTPYLKGGPWSFTIARDTSQQKKNQSNTNNCGGKYIATAPSDKKATGNTFSAGQQISIGFFRLDLTKVTSASGTKLSGEGTITVPYLHAPIIVEFTGLKVNAESEVIGGSATAKIDPNTGISSTLANKLGDLGMKNSDITSVMKVANEAQKLVSALTTSTPVMLPIGLDNDIQGFPMTIGLMGMTFTDTIATLNAVASFPFPDLGPDVGLGVGARGIPFQPAGLGFDQGTLYLAQDLGYAQTGSFGFKFKAPSNADSGTYMTWDCKGFKELRLRADVIFPREWLTPVPDNSGQVAAHLLADIRKPGDWFAAAAMDSCQIAGGSGMVLTVKDMTYDHSDVRNPKGIVFPSNYPKAKTGIDWHGFYIHSATITLPKDLQTFKGSPPKINVSNMIIDGVGFTATFLATNVIQYPNGNFGQWGASLDSIGVKFACSSLTNGWLSGRIQIPISDSALVYSATLSLPQKGGTKFIFNIHPTSELKADVWFATLNLDPTSSIVVADSASKFFATATLNGHFSINGNVGDLPKIDFQMMKFEGFTLTTNSPYIKAGTWKFASPQHSMSGFPVTISNVGITTGQRKNGFGVGLKFSVSANIADVISGETALSIWGVMNPTNNTGQKFAFDGVDVDTIKVDADLGAVQVNGSIALYHDDPTFGNGFRGMLDATFIKTVEVSAVAQFGSVNNYRYWYVDASAVFDAGISFGPVAMYGIGGGAWYHMKPGTLPSKIDGTPPAAKKPGTSLSGMTFTPDVSSDFGFLANAVVGVSGRPQVFVCSVTLGANFVNGGIGSIFLNGSGYILASESSVTAILTKKDATVMADAQISYDFTKSIFEGKFHFYTSPSLSSVFGASGQMNIHFDPQNWHVLIGTPPTANRIKLTLLSLAQVNAYVMAGTDIPAPDLSNFPHKADIEKAIGQPLPVASRPLTGGPASGFAMGATLQYSGDFTFAVFYAHMDFGMGFDIAVINAKNAICSNTNAPPGVNGWFGYGQLFAYANFQMGIKVDMTFVHGKFVILDMGAGALCQFQAPDPIWVQGIVGGHFSILGGLVEGHAAFTFEIGQKCEVVAENPLKIDLFTGAAPDNGSTDVDVFGTPSFSIRFPINQEVDLQTLGSSGQAITKSYRISFESFKLSKVNGNGSVLGHTEISQDGHTEYFVSTQPLPQYTKLRLDAEVQGFEMNDHGQWVPTKDMHGNPIVQDTSIVFTTGKRPDSIETRNVSWSTPMDGEKYFLYGEQNHGTLYLNIDMKYLFDLPGKYLVRFLPVKGGTSVDEPLTYSEKSNTITFPLAGIQPSTEYALQVIRQTKQKFVALVQNFQVKTLGSQGGHMGARGRVIATVGSKTFGTVNNTGNKIAGLDSLNIASPKFVPPGLRVRANEKLLYVLYFITSKHATLAEKIAQLKVTGVSHSVYWGIHENLVVSFGSDEGWDDYDMHGFTKRGRNSSNNQHADPLIMVDAVHTGQSWFTNYAKKSIYDHIFELAIRRLWDPTVGIADGRVYGQPSWSHPDAQAAYVSSSTGKVSPPYGGGSPMPHSLLGASGMEPPLPHGYTVGPAYAYTLQVRDLHGANIPTDFSVLYLTTVRVLTEYYSGGANDEYSEIFGKGAWIHSSLSWMQKLGSHSVFNYTSLYTPMYQGNYKIDFAYSPTFNWGSNGPWISKNFTYGNPAVYKFNNSAKTAKPTSAGPKRIIRH